MQHNYVYVWLVKPVKVGHILCQAAITFLPHMQVNLLLGESPAWKTQYVALHEMKQLMT